MHNNPNLDGLAEALDEATHPPRHFYQMTADELANYTGDVWTARCIVRHKTTGNDVAHDMQAPTRDMLVDLVRDIARRLGSVVAESHSVAYACCRETVKTGKQNRAPDGVWSCPTCERVLTNPTIVIE